MRAVAEALRIWLETGGHAIGQIYLTAFRNGWELCHQEDAGSSGLTAFSGAEAARELAQYDDTGAFRPLKTAPNLRRGWRLIVSDLTELRRALDYFYPAMLGVWLSQTRGELRAVPLRVTLARQTGMYRVTQKITDAQAQQMIGSFCRSDGGCLKQILWPLAPGAPITSLPAEKFSPDAEPDTLPLLCHEACNLLIAKAREVVKKTAQPS